MEYFMRRNGADAPFSELTLSGARITRRKSAADEFRAVFADPSKAEGFSTGETLEIYAGGKRKFRGRIARLDTRLGGGDDSVEIVARGPVSYTHLRAHET